MAERIRALIVATSHATLGSSGRATGVWLEELAAPYYTFIDAGADVDVASIAGGRIPIDPGSIQAAGTNPPAVERLLRDPDAMRRIETSLNVDDLAADEYNIIFLPGGHGTMWDLPGSAGLARLVLRAWSTGRIVAAVCHGPAGLVNLKDETGEPLVSGRRVSAFTNDEEKAVGLDNAVPFLLESRLRELGARFEGAPSFRAHAVCDGRLVTGQNPASSAAVARLALEAARTPPASYATQSQGAAAGSLRAGSSAGSTSR